MLDIRRSARKPIIRQRLRATAATRKRSSRCCADERRRKPLTEVEQLKAARNRVSKEIGALMAQKRPPKPRHKKPRPAEMGTRIAQPDKQTVKANEQRDALLLQLPNPAQQRPSRFRPIGCPTILKCAPDGRRQSSRRFQAVRHTWRFAQNLRSGGFRAGREAGRAAGFLLYTGWGARLERALIQLLLDLHTGEHGYTEISPPFLVNRDCMVGVGQFPKFADQYYAVQEGTGRRDA